MHRVRGILLYHLFCVLVKQGEKVGRDYRGTNKATAAIKFNRVFNRIRWYLLGNIFNYFIVRVVDVGGNIARSS